MQLAVLSQSCDFIADAIVRLASKKTPEAKGGWVGGWPYIY